MNHVVSTTSTIKDISLKAFFEAQSFEAEYRKLTTATAVVINTSGVEDIFDFNVEDIFTTNKYVQLIKHYGLDTHHLVVLGISNINAGRPIQWLATRTCNNNNKIAIGLGETDVNGDTTLILGYEGSRGRFAHVIRCVGRKKQP